MIVCIFCRPKFPTKVFRGSSDKTTKGIRNIREEVKKRILTFVSKMPGYSASKDHPARTAGNKP